MNTDPQPRAQAMLCIHILLYEKLLILSDPKLSEIVFPDPNPSLDPE
jgi:hypothetical protein